jgi:hypothetical protein
MDDISFSNGFANFENGISLFFLITVPKTTSKLGI